MEVGLSGDMSGEQSVQLNNPLSRTSHDLLAVLVLSPIDVQLESINNTIVMI